MSRQGILGTRFDEAVSYALAAHDSQRRKGTQVPYGAHLLGVVSLVLEADGSEDEASAGLLHDVVEDQGGADRLADVRSRFGDRIADVVLECSADDKTDDPGWRTRKKRYIDGIGTCSDSALLVSLADKVYNARSIVEDLRLLGPSMLERFGADEPKGQSILWFYRSLVDAYGDRQSASPKLLGELDRTVRELGRLVGPPPCPDCGSANVVEIIWGFPSAETFDEAEAGRVELGGCDMPADPADFRCRDCEKEWVDPQYAR